MKAKQLFLVLTLWIFVLSVSSCTTANEEQPIPTPEATSTQTTAPVSQSGPTDPLELEKFLDAYLAEQMSALHVPGATFVLVKDGDIFFAKGYGYADLENRIPYEPDETVFWAASVAKAVTAVGMLQLYERGLIDLDDDVNRHLEDFQIPNNYPKPATFAHLLTHTDGFEARIGGDAARTASEIRPLREVVQQHMPAQIAEPGRFLTYGNFATNLAGVLIEDVSGLPFARYMDVNIFQPLGMNRTTFEQVLPSDWGPDLAVGYRYHNGVYEPQPYVYANLLPQGGMRSTAADMARFMIALLQGGNYVDSRILNGPTVRLLFQQQFSSHPRLAGITYGLFETFRNDQRLLIRDGDGWGFRSRMVLMPKQNLGFFVNYNNQDADVLRDDLVSQFLDHYYPVQGQAPSTMLADSQEQADQYAGVYNPLQWDQTTFTKIALLFGYQVRVTANDDGTLTIAGM
jgi:CubicO group peptidase (beta-lactamase class C family)